MYFPKGGSAYEKFGVPTCLYLLPGVAPPLGVPHAKFKEGGGIRMSVHPALKYALGYNGKIPGHMSGTLLFI